jgi:RNA polymerase sigma factor (sigma-70 family)
VDRLAFGILTTQTDARLAELAAQGHERPFEELVARHRPALERYCSRLLPDGQAEDAVQQALWQAWRALRAGVVVADVRPWLYAIVRNQSMTTLRRRRDVEQLDEAAPGLAVDGGLEARATLRTAFSVLGGMRGPQREALVRTALNGESQDVIARDLGLSGGAVRQLVHRARAELRAAVTALVPFPLVEWFSVGGAGSVAPVALRGGAAIVAVGAALTAAPAVAHHHDRPAAPRAARVTPRSTPDATTVARRVAQAATPRPARPQPHHRSTPRAADPPPAARTIRVSAPPRAGPTAAQAPAATPTTRVPAPERASQPTRTAGPSVPAPTTTAPVAAPAPAASTAPQPATAEPAETTDDKGGGRDAGTTTGTTQTDDHGGGGGGQSGSGRSPGGSGGSG